MRQVRRNLLAAATHRGGPETAGAVGRTDQRARHDAEEADLLSGIAEHDEVRRFHPAGDRMVPGRGTQVLSDRDEIATGIVQILQRRDRSEEHTSELQSRGHLVCRLLLEKKKETQMAQTYCH